MISQQIARLIADQLIFLEFCSDEVLHPNSALKAMERLVFDMEQLDRGFLRELVDSFGVIADDYEDPESAAFVRDIPFTFCLEEALAEGDPEALARLEAVRDARGW